MNKIMTEDKWKTMNKICPWNYIGEPPYIKCPIHSTIKTTVNKRPPKESICTKTNCPFYYLIGEM
jgi:hypothetical protein